MLMGELVGFIGCTCTYCLGFLVIPPLFIPTPFGMFVFGGGLLLCSVDNDPGKRSVEDHYVLVLRLKSCSYTCYLHCLVYELN